MKNQNIVYSLAGVLVLACIFVGAQTNKKEEQNTSNNSVDKIQQDSQSTKPNYKPKNGYVPDEETAITIAVAVWNPIYGKEKIRGEKPYKATLKNGVWTVRGSLPKGWVGGVAEAEISKDDGRILRVIHGK